MNTMYDDQLKEIEVFKVHPSLLPYIGDDYNKHRILHIGESHYIYQNPKCMGKYGLMYFNYNWWNNECMEMFKEVGHIESINTRGVVNHFLSGVKDRSYTIFSNTVKIYDKVALKEVNKNSDNIRKIYNCFSFMNFFQMPSIFYGYGFWKSLVKSEKENGSDVMAIDVWKGTVKRSVEVVDQVINILKPKGVIFTSLLAGDAYKKYKNNTEQVYDNEKIIITSHPNYPYTWNKRFKRFGGKTGEEWLEYKLRELLCR